MSDDTKIDFYLANRALIEEWAALRTQAASALETSLLSGMHRFGRDDELPMPRAKQERHKEIALFFSEDPLPNVRLMLWWQTGDLFKGQSGWPYIALVINPKWKSLRDNLRSALAGRTEALGMPSKGKANESWFMSGRVAPAEEPIEIEAYADYCLERLRIAFEELREMVGAEVTANGTTEA